jgi:choline dehydrogenase
MMTAAAAAALPGCGIVPRRNRVATHSRAYDFIIVGGGSAGCVLASRLSEDPHRSVLLIEAGPDYKDEQGLPPEIRSSFMVTSTHDWGYAAEPFGTPPRSIPLPRGRLLGGCSATNATVALRGHPADYDEWAKLGNVGWSFDEILPFFRRLENDDAPGDWHGRSGPLPIRRYLPSSQSPASAFLEACYAAGHRRVFDHNAPGEIGAGMFPTNRIAGVRQSTMLTYLGKARGRPNLTIRSESLVDRVLFEGRRAIGVRLDGANEAIWSDRVIVSAGAYNSPAILMRSGIGPARLLKELSIPIVEERAGVGQNLIDHPRFVVTFDAKTPGADDPFMAGPILTMKSSKEVRGIDLQTYFIGIRRQASGSYVLGTFVSVMKPKSRGQLRLRSSEARSAPMIDMGYFAHPDDMPRMITAVRELRRLTRTSPLADLIIKEESPGYQLETAAELEAAIRGQFTTYFHPVGSCKMGPSQDSEAVVDSRGNVHGVSGLSVVDASIMPTIPSANTNVPTIMVAERCAEWLRKS